MNASPHRDVIVIGGGLLGWSLADRLTRAGLGVTVVDRADAGEATAAGAGIIAPGTSFKRPDTFYQLARAAMAHYPRLIADLAADGETDTGYEVVGALFVARDAAEAAELPAARAAMAERRAGGMGHIGDARLVDGVEAKRRFPALADLPGAIWVPEAARVNGRLLRDALRRAARQRGARTIAGDATPVREGERIVAVRVGAERLPTDAVVIAAGAWSAALGEAIGVRIPVYPQRGQIIHLDLPQVDTGAWPIVIGFHAHYLLTFRPHRVVMGATREHDSGYDVRTTAGGIHEVLTEGLRVAPGLRSATIAEIRIGLRPSSPDFVPLLGRAPGLTNAFLLTGHGPSGLQLGPYSAAAVADLIRGRDPGIDLSPFDAARFAGEG